MAQKWVRLILAGFAVLGGLSMAACSSGDLEGEDGVAGSAREALRRFPTCRSAGKHCSTQHNTCCSGVCIQHLCQPPSCSDGVKNGDESDVDCGGGCAACAEGKACQVADDCASQSCIDALCSPPQTCDDGERNGDETDVDCGGDTCPRCGSLKICNGSEDCISSVCAGIPRVCQLPTCSDGAKNASESDVDCGGMACPRCLLGKNCNVPEDCVVGVCNAGTCACETRLCTATSDCDGLVAGGWDGPWACFNGCCVPEPR